MTNTETLIAGALLGTIGAWVIIAIGSWLYGLVFGPRDPRRLPAEEIVKLATRSGEQLLRAATGGSPQTQRDHDKGR